MLLRLYADCLQRAVRGLRKNPWTLAVPVAHLAIIEVAGILLGPLGIVGGFLLGIVVDLCLSSFLYFTGQTVLASRTRPSELKRSFVEYFWPVVSFGFVIWMATKILGYALIANPQGGTIQLAIWTCAAVLLNAVPEVIYQKGNTGGIAIISDSVAFIQKHWIEWFIPNLLLGAIVIATTLALLLVPFGGLVEPLVGGVLGYFVAVFRGNLFHILETTSPFGLRSHYRKP